MSDAYLPCPDCEGTGRARPNEHGAYVAGDPENCNRCGGKGTSYDLACPSCSERTPDHLLCACDAPECTDCHNREHPRRCPDCYGHGELRVSLAREGSAGAKVGIHINRDGFRLTATCATCEGSGRINEKD